jgi:hypothetical protein
LICLINLPQVVFILYYSVKNFDRFNSCDRPLNLWLLLFGARLLMSTIVAGLPVCYPREWHPLGERYRRMNDVVNLLGFTIFILGNFWLFDR